MARKAKVPKGKRMNPTFFVFCEGKTEAAYVDLLRHTYRVPVEIITRISDSNISQGYIDRCRRDRFTTCDDKTFVMFDLDVSGMFERLSRLKDVTLLLSNPCVEYWFLLHYKSIFKELSTSECLTSLKKIDADYAKGKISSKMKSIMLTNVQEAVKRAKSTSRYNNPSSTVYLLIEDLHKHK